MGAAGKQVTVIFASLLSVAVTLLQLTLPYARSLAVVSPADVGQLSNTGVVTSVDTKTTAHHQLPPLGVVGDIAQAIHTSDTDQ